MRRVEWQPNFERINRRKNDRMYSANADGCRSEEGSQVVHVCKNARSNFIGWPRTRGKGRSRGKRHTYAGARGVIQNSKQEKKNEESLRGKPQREKLENRKRVRQAEGKNCDTNAKKRTNDEGRARKAYRAKSL